MLTFFHFSSQFLIYVCEDIFVSFVIYSHIVCQNVSINYYLWEIILTQKCCRLKNYLFNLKIMFKREMIFLPNRYFFIQWIFSLNIIIKYIYIDLFSLIFASTFVIIETPKCLFQIDLLHICITLHNILL